MAKIRFYGRAGRKEKNNVWDHAFLKMLHWTENWKDTRIASHWFHLFAKGTCLENLLRLVLHTIVSALAEKLEQQLKKKKHKYHFFLILPILENRDRDHFSAYGAEQSWHLSASNVCDKIISNLSFKWEAFLSS